MRAGHADVALESGVAAEQRGVCRGDVRVRAEHGGGATREVPAERLFFGGRLGMDLDERGVVAPGVVREEAVGGREGAIDLRAHEIAAEHGGHEQARAVLLDEDVRAPGVGRGEVGRATDVVERADLILPPLLVPHVIAERDHVDAGFEQALRDRPGDAGSGGGVLGVGDDEIERVLDPQARHEGGDGVAAGASHDVADEEEFHRAKTATARASFIRGQGAR